MKKVRILQLITRLSRGGASRFLISLCEYLTKENFEILLLSGKPPPGEDGCFNQLEKKHIPYQIIPGLSRNISPLRDLKSFFRLSQAIKKFKPHILHTHTSKAGILGRWAGKINGVPIIVHQGHGLALGEQWKILEITRFPITVKFLVWLEKITAGISDRLITYSITDIIEHLQLGIGSKSQFLSLYCGIDLEKFQKKEISRSAFGLEKDDKLVGTAGRLVRQKGLEYLIEAAKLVHTLTGTSSPYPNGHRQSTLDSKVSKVKSQRSKVKFLIIGDGPLKKSLEEKTKRLGLEHSVIFLGWREDMANVLNLLDLYIQPSLYESFGIALAEAQACTIPVIAAESGSLPELIKHGETGLLIPPENPSAIVSAIHRLLDNPALARKIGAAGSLYVKENYALPEIMEKFKELYLNLLKTAPKKSPPRRWKDFVFSHFWLGKKE